MENSITSEEGNAARGVGANAEHATDAACSDSRLVIRDERNPSGIPLAEAESLVADPFPDFEAEIYRFEIRRGEATLVAHPIAYEGTNPNAAHIDWCAFTVREPQGNPRRWIDDELCGILGFDAITPRKTGLYGYAESAIIDGGGLVAWGGKNQRGTIYVSLNAQGCARIKNWQTVHDRCVFNHANLTRVDPAHDDLLGTSMTIEEAHALWLAGGFNSGGRRPAAHPAGDWWGLSKGRTVYVGERLNGKLLRVYEKGKQLGDPASPWVRIELELHNKNRLIPLDILLKPGAYLAGAYPCLTYLSVEQIKIKIIRRAAKISYDRAVEVARQQYGKLVNLMLHVHGGEYAEVVRALKRDGLPSKLKQYGYELDTDPAILDELAVGRQHETADLA